VITPKIDVTEEKKRFPKLTESQIIEAMRYYDMGLIADHIYQQPGCPDRAATLKLVDFWNRRFLEAERNHNLEERQILSVNRICHICSDILSKMMSALNDITAQIDHMQTQHNEKMAEYERKGQADKIHPFKVDVKLESLRLEYFEEIHKMSSFLYSYESMPTAYEMHKEEIRRNFQEMHDQASCDYGGAKSSIPRKGFGFYEKIAKSSSGN
jgi:hypothetical protein